MSLINDALKRAEKSLNNSSDQHRERIPSFDFEPSGKNKKLFFILLIGGTLFFTALIALIMILRSPVSTPNTTPPIISPTIPATEIVADKKNLDTIEDFPNEESPKPVEQENKGITVNEVENPNSSPKDTDSSSKVEDTSVPNSVSSPPAENTITSETEKDLGNEFFESVVGLASKAFKNSTPSNKIPEKSQSNEAPKEDYSLSTAQNTLEMLEKQAKENKETNTPEDPITEFIQSLYITGVMISSEGSQVLMNNQVYSNNSIISQKLHLILSEIKPHSITIRDSNGKTYIKEF